MLGIVSLFWEVLFHNVFEEKHPFRGCNILISFVSKDFLITLKCFVLKNNCSSCLAHMVNSQHLKKTGHRYGSWVRVPVETIYYTITKVFSCKKIANNCSSCLTHMVDLSTFQNGWS